MRMSWSALRKEIREGWADALFGEACSCALGLVGMGIVALWEFSQVSRWVLVLVGLSIVAFVSGKVLSHRAGRACRKSRRTTQGGDPPDG